MIPRFVILAAFIISALYPAAAPGTVPEEALGTVNYDVRYKLAGVTTKVADAAISLKNDTWEGKAVLHSHAAIRANSVFRLFMASEYTADSYATRDTQEPVYYVNPLKKGKKEGKLEYFYDGRTLDLLSLIQYVRFQDIPQGATKELYLLVGGKSVKATLTNQGTDRDRFPGKDTERFFLVLTERGLMENGSGNEIKVWRSTEKERRILGLETALSAGVMTVSVKD